MTDALRELAEKAGITRGYSDIFGHYHEASEDVLRELLHALNALPERDADPAPALQAWEDAQWRRVLPPVAVIFEDELSPSVRVVLPERYLERPLNWRLIQEDGEVAQAHFDAGQCPFLGERWLDGQRHVAYGFGIAHGLEPGYHRLEILDGEAVLGSMSLVAAPEHCYQPEAVSDGGRVWGPALQLYSVRSARNWGMGDFTDLKRLAEQWGEQGADVIGLNPLHALFIGNPPHTSPYSPSSRRFLNVLYIDVEAVPEFADCEPAREWVRSGEFQLRLQALRETDLVDYAGVAAAKLGVLEQLYRYFRAQHLGKGSERGRAFRAYQHHQGAALRQYAVYEALYEHVRGQDPHAWGWMQWPEAWRDPHGPAVAAFEAEHAERIEYFEYLQWQAEQQLTAVAAHTERLGLGVGLYLDLAVSVDRGGADAWRNQGLYAGGASVGAPPDDFNRQGQDWGLPPFDPNALREAAYGPFIGALRENMGRAGALRIDHVMGLMRLFWIPPGRSAKDGGYVRYGFEEMMGIVALESHRNRCLVIGEDLGTVPPEVPEAMRKLRMLSYRVLYFEQEEHGLKAPTQYPADALATVTTHDLPTLYGYWAGHDVTLRHELGLFGSDEVRAAQVEARARDRARMLLALEKEGLLPEGLSADPSSAPEMTEPLARAFHEYLARAPSKLMMVQPEEVLGMVAQVNFPGGPEEKHPNWRRKLTLELEAWPQHDGFLRMAAVLAQERPRRRRVRRRRPAVKIPRATYRFQFHAGFSFRDAAALAPYLARLGVSHVYCSPYLKARPGSTHGYDIIDHNALNPEIGSGEDYQAFVQALEEHGLSQILDIVPNHMGVMGADNQWWLDVLENGPASVHAGYFDIDWRPQKLELRDKVLLPVLGGPYGEVLERGELSLRFDAEAGAFSVWYYDHRMPIAPEEYPRLLGHRLDALALRLGAADPQLLELQSLLTAFGNLPGRGVAEPERRLERQRDVQLHKQRLARLCAEAPAIAQHLEEVVRELNGDPQDPASFNSLHELLEQQAYRLAHWHAAADEINYRRFFDIHDLAALRMEDPRVFEATHQLILGLLRDGTLEGLRVDHPDGLYDPEAYFRRLQSEAGEEGCYLLVEKILAVDEPLPEDWPVHGTTGYEAMNLINGVFVDTRAERNLRRFYAVFTGERLGFEELVYKCKRLIMKYALASELNVLANVLNRMSEADRHTRDFTLNRLRGALAEVVAWLPVYRTYAHDGRVSDTDRRYLGFALAKAREGSRAEETGVFDFLESVLLRKGLRSEEAAERASRFVMRLQQYTGAVMAKSLEDTAFYRYFPLVSLNEVGGDPQRFGVPLEAFHAEVTDRRRRWPYTMLATSTHDSKRSEDVRARLNVLSELPREWRRAVRRWAELAAPLKREVDGAPAPSRNDEYLLYQTLIGAWPLEALDAPGRRAFAERIEAYMLKAVREAKQHTSWINRNPPYEEALSRFVHGLIELDGFRDEFLPLAQRVAAFGLYNSLSQTLLKLTLPGLPDIYQGNEVWDFSLVDPDNRRPVDYPRRMRLLEELFGQDRASQAADGGLPASLLCSIGDGRAKIFLTAEVLSQRRQHETLFRDGDYLPLASSGSKAEHLCAFARQGEGTALVIAPRLPATLLGDHERHPLGEGIWGDTRIDVSDLGGAAEFINVLTGERVAVREEAGGRFIRVCEALAEFPVALLMRAG